MQGLQDAQRLYDKRLPGDQSNKPQREFQHPEQAPAGANVIRSTKIIYKGSTMFRYSMKVKTREGQTIEYSAIAPSHIDAVNYALDIFGACGVTVKPVGAV